jgi:hypothetical protein
MSKQDAQKARSSSHSGETRPSQGDHRVTLIATGEQHDSWSHSPHSPTRASDHGSGDAQEPAAVVVDCSMHQAPRSHLFPYAVKM